MVCTQGDNTTLRADRDKEIALADADLQKQLTGNESAHTTAVNNANSAHSTATGNAEAARKSAEQAALSQLNSTLAQATKDKEASIAGAERTYDQAVASLDAQYGSESSNGDTGVEGATRRSAIKTRDAQYYATRDTSWANTLSGSTTLGTSPWSVKAITAANAQAAYSTSRASAQAAHDAAMLDAIEDWQLSSRESLTDLFFTEGQSRETFNVATSNVYATWENGIGNLLGDKPEGTGYVPVRGFGEGGVGTWVGAGGGVFTRFEEGEDETTTSGEEVDNVEPPRPTLPAPETNNSQPPIYTVTDGSNDPPGAGEWILKRGRVVESCLRGKTLYCVGEWLANDSGSRDFLTEKGMIDQLRRSGTEGQDNSTVQPPRVDVIFLPLDQFPSRGRAYFEDDLYVNGTTKDIAKAAGLDPSKQIRIVGEYGKEFPFDRYSTWTDGEMTLWVLESRYVKNGVTVHCGYQFFSSREEMAKQVLAQNIEIFRAAVEATTGLAAAFPTTSIARKSISFGTRVVDNRGRIEALANSYLGFPNSSRPATVASLSMLSGTFFSGRSGSKTVPHEVITRFFSAITHANDLKCAEIDAITRALVAHELATGTKVTTLEQAKAVLAGARIQTAKVRPPLSTRTHEHGAPLSPCENGCDILLKALGIVFE